MKSLWKLAAAVILAFGPANAVPVAGAGAGAHDDAPFSFIALGDVPYTDPFDYLRFSALITRINERAPAFSVHVGDIKAGSRSCTDERLMKIRDYFDRFESALIYTPGDNEWTDCHRIPAGGWDPLDRLDLLRRHYFAEPRSLGQAPIKLTRQADLERGSIYVENARWARSGIGFLTAHVVGTYNNSETRTKAGNREFKARDAASSAWIKRGFDWAVKTKKKGLAVFIHADPLRGRKTSKKVSRAYRRTVDALITGATRFRKPVLLVHGDLHTYKLDQPFRTPKGKTVANLTRVEVHGAPEVWAVEVKVDPASPKVFAIAPLPRKEERTEPPD